MLPLWLTFSYLCLPLSVSLLPLPLLSCVLLSVLPTLPALILLLSWPGSIFWPCSIYYFLSRLWILPNTSACSLYRIYNRTLPLPHTTEWSCHQFIHSESVSFLMLSYPCPTSRTDCNSPWFQGSLTLES